MDNLSVHRSKVVKQRLEELSIKCVFNSVYSPDFNPIENIFSVASHMIKRKRLDAIMVGVKLNLDEVIHECFNRIKRESILNCV